MKYEISDAEMEIMNILWKSNQEVTSAQINVNLPKSNDWKPSTLLTLCKRLEDKGFVKRRKEGKINYYLPLVSREEYKALQTQLFFKEIHSGSFQSLMASLHNSAALSKQDVEELKRWLKGV